MVNCNWSANVKMECGCLVKMQKNFSECVLLKSTGRKTEGRGKDS